MASDQVHSLPATQTALTLQSVSKPLELKTVPLPSLVPGSAIVQVLSSSLLAYASDLYSGALPYPLYPPQTVSGGAIGRVVAVGSDATTLSPGQLVLIDPMVRGRDDSTKSILMGIHGGISEEAAKLMKGDWRDGSAAEYARWPLENVHPLNEQKLAQYTPHDLVYLQRLLVPMGGLRVLDVRAGDRVIIAPATGQFGGAAVEVALAMGADVIICGRKLEALESMKSTLMQIYHGSIDVVQWTGEVEADVQALQKFGPVDKYLDFSPDAAAKSTHIASCLMALKKGGRACFQGGIVGPVSLPYPVIMFNDLSISGKFMYEKSDAQALIQLVESGRLQLDLKGNVEIFSLTQWKQAFGRAKDRSGWRELVTFEPGKK